MEKAVFDRERLAQSKTFGYGADLIRAVLEDRKYTKAEAEAAILNYLQEEREEN